MSGANSGIYSASRMLFKLSVDHEVSPFFSKLSKRVVPNVAILTIAGWILVGFILNTILTQMSKTASNLFVIVYSASVLPGMVPWFVILLSELQFRKQNADLMKNHPFKMPLYPFYNYFATAALLIILAFMFINPDTRVSVSVGVVFLVIMSLIYFIRVRKHEEPEASEEADFENEHHLKKH